MKKGQITIWIIIGVIILVLTSLLFFIDRPEPTQDTLDVSSVKSSVKSCIHSSTSDALVLVGKQGGYFNENGGVTFVEHTIPIYFDKGVSKIPDMNTLEKELAAATWEPLDSCLFLVSLEYPQLDLTLGEVHSSISENSIRTFAEVSLKINEEAINSELVSEKTTILDLSEDLLVDYGKLQTIANQIVEIQENSPKGLPLSDIMELAEENNVQFEIITINDTLLLSLVDWQLFNAPYYFTFGLKHNEVSFEEDIQFEKELMEALDN